MEGSASSWILFVYTAEGEESSLPHCDEGTLAWVPVQDLSSQNIIGFIRHVLSLVLDNSSLFEGTIVHNRQGEVVSETLKVYALPSREPLQSLSLRAR